MVAMKTMVAGGESAARLRLFLADVYPIWQASGFVRVDLDADVVVSDNNLQGRAVMANNGWECMGVHCPRLIDGRTGS